MKESLTSRKDNHRETNKMSMNSNKVGNKIRVDAAGTLPKACVLWFMLPAREAPSWDPLLGQTGWELRTVTGEASGLLGGREHEATNAGLLLLVPMHLGKKNYRCSALSGKLLTQSPIKVQKRRKKTEMWLFALKYKVSPNTQLCTANISWEVEAEAEEMRKSAGGESRETAWIEYSKRKDQGSEETREWQVTKGVAKKNQVTPKVDEHSRNARWEHFTQKLPYKVWTWPLSSSCFKSYSHTERAHQSSSYNSWSCHFESSSNCYK